jgi:hypothetical protein
MADIRDLDVILGFPWLEEADPIILWKQYTFVFLVTVFSVRFCVSRREIQKAVCECCCTMITTAYLVVNDLGDSSDITSRTETVTLP